MTLNEKYYAINTRISNFLTAQEVKNSPVYKYGIDPAVLREDSLNSTNIRYPYIQTWVGNSKQTSWTSKESGIYTTFDFQMSYFTAPQSEFTNDSKYFYPFEVAKNGLADIRENLLVGIATITSTEGPYQFDMKSGQAVPSSVMLYRMATVCSYSMRQSPVTTSTDLSAAIVILVEE